LAVLSRRADLTSPNIILMSSSNTVSPDSTREITSVTTEVGVDLAARR
jgi:hypothetical protein